MKYKLINNVPYPLSDWEKVKKWAIDTYNQNPEWWQGKAISAFSNEFRKLARFVTAVANGRV